MSTCEQCHQHPPALGLLCEHCIAANRARASERTDTYHKQQVTLTATKGDFYYGALFKVLAGLALAVTVLNWSGAFGYGTLASVTLESRSSAAQEIDPCSSKRACLIAFLAPWCPACHHSIPFVKSARDLARQHPDLGVQIVVGASDLAELKKMGGEIGGPVYYDSKDEMANAIRGSSVPRWVIIDQNRKILNYGAGLPSIDQTHPGFEQYLKSMKFG